MRDAIAPDYIPNMPSIYFQLFINYGLLSNRKRVFLYNGFASALVSATAPPLYLRALRGWRPPAILEGRAIRSGPRAACVNQNWFHYSTA